MEWVRPFIKGSHNPILRGRSNDHHGPINQVSVRHGILQVVQGLELQRKGKNNNNWYTSLVRLDMDMGVNPKIVLSQNGWFFSWLKTLLKWMIWGGLTPIFGNTHI